MTCARVVTAAIADGNQVVDNPGRTAVRPYENTATVAKEQSA
jgi:hypothetical protein